jgi:hypothetical protein
MRKEIGWVTAVGAGWLASIASIGGAEAPLQPPGIYVEQAADEGEPGVDKLPLSRPTRTGTKDIAKTVVKGMLTGGLLGGGLKMVVVFAGPQAPVRLPAQPMFQFHFDPNAKAAPAPNPTDLAAAMAMMGQMDASSSDMPPGIARPQQFALVRLASKGEEREMEASSDMKPNRKHTVACRVRQLGPHVFRVAPEKPLPPGEYGFVAVGDGASGGIDRLWEFGVDAPASSAAR